MGRSFDGPSRLLSRLVERGLRRVIVALIGAVSAAGLVIAALIYLLEAIRTALVPYLNGAGAAAVTALVALALGALIVGLTFWPAAGRSGAARQASRKASTLGSTVDDFVVRLEAETRARPLSTVLLALVAGIAVAGQAETLRWLREIFRPPR